MTEMLQAIRDALGNYHYLFLYGAAILVLLVFLKGKRKAFVIPAILLTVVVLNPAFFKLWNKINDYAYWRTLWMIPVIPACAAVPALFVEKGKKTGTKGVIAAAGIVVFVLAGTWIGSHSLTRFSKPVNAEKLPAGALAVGNALLELDDTPYVIADNDVCIYLRQYSGNIHQMYGRDVYFGENSWFAGDAFFDLTSEDGDPARAAQIMLDHDYEYLVSKKDGSLGQETLEEAGFELIKEVDGYNIYRVTGHPTTVQTYNDRHQMVTLTFVDENGDPVVGPEGYVKREYEYDEQGRITRMFQTDASGNGMPDAEGRAGYERTFDRIWRITKEVSLGADGEPVDIGGFAVRICTYKGKRLESESYFKADGSPASVGPGYAKCEYTYTEDGELSLVWFYDADGQLIEAGSRVLHEYLESLKGRDVSIFISAKDEASNQMTVTLWEDMKELGIQTDLRGQFRKSFYAVVTPEGTQEELSEYEISCSGTVGGIPYTVASAGLEGGNYSSIVIDGKEYSKNERGLNIVVFDNKTQEVVESVSFDTFSQDMMKH